jgi:RHS repeat-associated protein
MNLKISTLLGLSWLLFLSTLQGQSLTLNDADNSNTPPSGVLDNKHYEAVNLIPGYDYFAAPGFKMNAFIDPTIVTPSSYSSLISQTEFEDYTIDPSLPVGYTPGVSSVSLSGASTYNISIQLPSGTNGMEPQLAIGYNSQSGNGLLGMGWNLAGLSAISRVPKTIHHDGRTDRIQFNNDDRFALDGNRLVSIGDDEYATEMETFSLIISHGSAGNGPLWFEVRTKDGLIMEYGKPDESRFVVTSNGEALNWMLNKVYDQHGNYIEYVYIQENNQIRIDKIRYTGNEVANLEPYNEIQFYYQYREDKSEGYLGGYQILKNSYLLKSIKSKSEGLQFRSYDFTYGFDGLNSFLSELYESGKDPSSIYNKTIFRYPSNSILLADFLTISNSGLPSSYTSSGSGCEMNYSYDPRVHYYPGDFNGDGVSDLLAVTHYTDNDYEGRPNSWAIFINETHLNGGWTCHELTRPFVFTNESGLNPYFPSSHFPVSGFSFHVGDLNGDGIDDVVFGYKKVSVNERIFYKGYFTNITDNQIDLVPSGVELELEDIEEEPHWLDIFSQSQYHRHVATLGDFDGDGIMEFVALNLRTFNYTITSFNGRVHFTHNEDEDWNGMPLASPYMGTAFDCDGDGRHSLYIYYDRGSGFKERIFHFDINSNGQLQHGNTFQKGLAYQSYGVFQPWLLNNLTHHSDFNGDGVPDRIKVDENNYYFQYHNGWSRQSDIDGDNYTTISFHEKSDTDIMQVADLNGDGRSDIIIFNSHPTNNIANIYLMKGELGGYEHHTIDVGTTVHVHSNFFFGDFNGDGVTNMGIYSPANSPEVAMIDFSFESKPENRRLSGIKNGFAQTLKFEYKTLAKTAYSPLHGERPDYPLRSIFGGFPVVQWVISENPLGQEVKDVYEFYGGIAHLQGKGFLGFRDINTRVENPAQPSGPGEPGEPFLEQRRTFQEFELDEENYLMTPYKTKQYAGAPEEALGNLVSEITFDYSYVGTDRFLVRLDGIDTHNYPSGEHNSEDYIYDNDGNLNIKTSVVGNENSIEITTTTYDLFFSFNDWHVPTSKPGTITLSSYRNQEPEITLQTNIDYNDDGTILSKTSRPASNAWSKETFTYNNNPFGLVESTTVSGLRPTENGINPNTGEILTTEEITPIVTDFYTYTTNGRNILTHTDVFGFVTEYTYNARWGVPKSVTNHLGQQANTTYDGFGHIIAQTDHLGNVVTSERQFYDFFTDEFNDCSSSTDVLFKEILEVNSGGAVRTNTKWFNKFGQIRRNDVTAHSGIVRTTTCYDKRGRTVETTSAHFIGEEDYKTSTFVYDKFDRVFTSNTEAIQISMDYEVMLTGGAASLFTSNVIGSRSKETDATGRIIKSKDSNNANTLDYIYQSGGLLKTTKLNGDIVAENIYDAFGRQIALNDPMASGTTIYQYDAFDRLVYQKDNKDNRIEIYFDDFGRLDKRKVSEPNQQDSEYTYEYYDSGYQESLLKKETAPSGISSEYEYDINGNIISIKEQVDEDSFSTEFEFDDVGKLEKKTFPSGFAIKYIYDSEGYLEKITSESGALIWQIGTINARNQLTQYTLGNGIQITYDFDEEDHFLKSTSAQTSQGLLFDFEYKFNPINGNLKHRKLGDLTEYFEYDYANQTLGLHRLTGTGLSENEMSDIFNYEDNGNISQKSGIGVYVYDPQKQNQVIEIDLAGGMDEGNPNAVISGQQFVIYNHFNSASSIQNVSDEQRVALYYGPDDQRRKAMYYEGFGENELWEKTRYYIGAYEKQVYPDNSKIEVHYISAGGMVVAMYVIEHGIGKYYYPHQDHLGSIIHVTDENAEIVYTQSFDAWGRTRNSDDLSYEDITERPNWLWRGYTGHEHLDEFGLINMNGRLYDPLIGRMLSPDNFVQSPEFSQSYNRYSYVWNNPLKYSDSDGEWVHLAIGAIVGGVQGYMFGKSAGLSGSQLFTATIVGAGIGAVSAGVANSIATGGGVMANTLAIATGSHANSVGMMAIGGITGVERSYSLSFGAGSLSVNSAGLEFGYLGKKGNSGLENVGYGLGALANISDLLMGFNSNNIGDVDLITEHSDGAGHSALVKSGSNTGGNYSSAKSDGSMMDPNGIISVGPDKTDVRSWHWKKGHNSWNTYSHGSKKNPIWRETIRVNEKSINKYAQSLNSKVNEGKLIYSVELNSCVTHTSRALNSSGVFNVGVHPYLLHSQMYLRNIGVRPSLFSFYTTTPY